MVAARGEWGGGEELIGGEAGVDVSCCMVSCVSWVWSSNTDSRFWGVVALSSSLLSSSSSLSTSM